MRSGLTGWLRLFVVCLAWVFNSVGLYISFVLFYLEVLVGLVSLFVLVCCLRVVLRLLLWIGYCCGVWIWFDWICVVACMFC